ncbi:hypothetical protein TELCIR_15591 [Teladorsagia circumcincta]|uniref:Symplekin C-terminal domain-containing protein n=1 Tax=Teladorsagia circumcincta TaxID=45464 RepID=A0A2G9TXX1_TELCI|nr:hypothetical protein TELCIR_15591 [Teladorsagia circumcincta]
MAELMSANAFTKHNVDISAQFGELLCSPDFAVAMTAAQRFDAAPLTDQVRLIPSLARAFLYSLDSIPQSYVEIIVGIWTRLENVVPRMLYETWPIDMIRPLVENIPSMFVATEYIQEMLALPNMKRRIFAVCLMAEVGRKVSLLKILLIEN